MRAWVIAVGLIAACGPEGAGEAPREEAPEDATPEDEASCEELRRESTPCQQFIQCAACFAVDSDGIGTCRAVLTELDEREMAAALAAAVSGLDAWKTECPERLTYLDHHATYAVTHAAEYERLADMKEALADQGIEVRVNWGCGENGHAFAGLDSFLRLSAADPAPTCCVGPECAGAEYRCEWPATEGAPSPCVAAN